MTKFDLLVADQPVGKNATIMIKTPRNTKKKGISNTVAVIKNGHTAAELTEMGERWVNHAGPYMTLEEVIAIERAKQPSSSNL